MTLSYEDGIIDAINIIRHFTSSGVYSIPALYVIEQLESLLPPASAGVEESK